MTGADPLQQQFYLDHFSGHSILIGDRSTAAVAEVHDTVRLLVGGGARVITIGGGRGGIAPQADDLGRLWQQLRAAGQVDVAVPADVDPWAQAGRWAQLLRPYKLVLLDPGALHDPDQPPPFVTLESPSSEEPTVRMAWQALAAGVDSVNVCRPDDIATELLTYRGAGVLYTREQYCVVDRLRLDDFDAAHRLIEQGVAAGYLLPRPPGEIARLLLAGYGARFGEDHLAGVASLRRYHAEQVAEVQALTTISRFAGGGVGGMIVRRMVADARGEGLQGVFACTTSAEAVGFFTALGFRHVAHEQIPEAKWAAYDPRRLTMVTALWCDTA